MKTFPTIVAGIFVALGLIAAVIFATFSASNRDTAGSVLIWGSLPDEAVSQAIVFIQEESDIFDSVSYEYVPEEQLIPRLVSAIASGTGPDAVFLSSSDLFPQRDKLQPVSYSSMPRRTFQDSYIEAGEIFLSDDGIYGLPFIADPLIMYWNRTLFADAGVSRAPVYWDEVATLASVLSQKSEGGTLLQSAVALGTWNNVLNAKGIFATLLKQLGNPIVAPSPEGGYSSVLNDRSGVVGPGDSGLRFYSEFADPAKPVYSWNRSQQNSRDAFLAGRLAMYFGRASELYTIRAANPNLNFDIARVPVVRGGGSQVEAELIAYAIPRGSRNPSGALQAGYALTSTSIQGVILEQFKTPSVRRDAVAGSASDQYQGIFRASALSSFAFLDPSDAGTDAIFAKMIEGVASGAVSVPEAVAEASGELDALLRGVQ